jgi:hypothetical protein
LTFPSYTLTISAVSIASSRQVERLEQFGQGYYLLVYNYIPNIMSNEIDVDYFRGPHTADVMLAMISTLESISHFGNRRMVILTYF